MKRASIDITGAGPHTIINPPSGDKILIHNVVITFSHAEPQSQLVWFNAGTNIEAGPFYVTDGGEIRYKSSNSDRRYIGGAGVPFVIEMDPALSAAGYVDYELGSF